MTYAKFDENDAESSTTAYALSIAFIAKSVLQFAGIPLDYNPLCIDEVFTRSEGFRSCHKRHRTRCSKRAST